MKKLIQCCARVFLLLVCLSTWAGELVLEPLHVGSITYELPETLQATTNSASVLPGAHRDIRFEPSTFGGQRPSVVRDGAVRFVDLMMPKLDPEHIQDRTTFRLFHYEGGTYQSREFFRRAGPDVVTLDSLVYHFRVGRSTLFGPAFYFMQPDARGFNMMAGVQLSHTFGWGK